MTLGTAKIAVGGCAVVTLALLSGCNSTAKEVVKSDYKVALNQYYQGWPRCIWPDSVSMPIETSDPAEKAQYDALAGLGLLRRAGGAKAPVRKTAAKATYDLTEQGKSVWTPDVLSPGAGNFCYGRPQVTTVDRSKRNTASSDVVDFHYTIPDPPSWATNSTTQDAFPKVKTELSGPHVAEAVLVDTTDGYRVQGAPKMVDPASIPVKPEKKHRIRKMLQKIRAKV